jgi:hypothetical protein
VEALDGLAKSNLLSLRRSRDPDGQGDEGIEIHLGCKLILNLI